MKKSFVGFVFALTMSAGCYAQPGPRLIVRGDDMGFSHSGNEALIKSYREGIEKSIEVIVPSPWFMEAVKMLKDSPGVDIGIHLALTSEWENVKWRPLTEAKGLRDANGYFLPMIFPNKNYPGLSLSERKVDVAEVEKEFRAQIETALKFLPNISHLSAHMGCAWVNDDVRLMTLRLAKEYKISGIEFEKSSALNRTGFEGSHGTAAEKVESFVKMLNKLEPGKAYVFVEHPGIDNAELRAIFHIGYENVAEDRQGVTDLFTSEVVKKALVERHIQLISYADVSK